MDALKSVCLISLKSALASGGLFIDICLERGKYLIAIGGSFRVVFLVDGSNIQVRLGIGLCRLGWCCPWLF